jgi:imidazolonepropionase-like amidohydrolase
MTGPVQSDLRALNAINPADPGISSALTGGITTVNILPGSGNVVGGQTAYVKLKGKSIEEMLIHKQGIQGGMKMANGENPKQEYGPKGQSPSTRMAIAALQRALFIRAKEYKTRWDRYKNASKEEKVGSQPPVYDLELEPMVEVLEGKRTVHFHTHWADDIMTILRLKKEFGFDLVLHHVTEGYLVREQIKKEDVPVPLAPTMQRLNRIETQNSSYENKALLWDMGIQIAITSGYESYVPKTRIVSFETGIAMANKLPEEEALRAITIKSSYNHGD